jgi:hypothetical protein
LWATGAPAAVVNPFLLIVISMIQCVSGVNDLPVAADYSRVFSTPPAIWPFLSLLFLDPVTLLAIIFIFLQTNVQKHFLTH